MTIMPPARTDGLIYLLTRFCVRVRRLFIPLTQLTLKRYGAIQETGPSIRIQRAANAGAGFSSNSIDALLPALR